MIHSPGHISPGPISPGPISPGHVSPGQYLARQRAAAGLSVDDVAAMIATVPRLAEIDRRAWLLSIEADTCPVTLDVFAALAACFPVDPAELQQCIDKRIRALVYRLTRGGPLCCRCGGSKDALEIIETFGEDACFDAWPADFCLACAALPAPAPDAPAPDTLPSGTRPPATLTTETVRS